MRWRDPTEAMSADTYRAVLEGHGRMDTSTFREHGPDDEYTQEQLYLRQDFSKNKAVWVGDFSKDLWYYLSNINPIVAAFYSHPLHPISRVQRWIVYAISVVFVSNVTGAITLSSECQLCNADSSENYTENCNEPVPLYCEHLHNDTDHYFQIQNLTKYESWRLPMFCCRSRRWGALWFLDTFGDYGPVLFSFLANLVFSLTCFQLMMCPCVQQQSMSARKCGETVGILFFFVVALMTYLWAWRLPGDLFRLHRLVEMAETFALTKLLSWFGASIFNVSLFCLLFWLQKPKAQGSRWRWLDAPEDHQAEDPRPGWVKAVNARFHVLSSEHRRWATPVPLQDDHTKMIQGSFEDDSGISLQDLGASRSFVERVP